MQCVYSGSFNPITLGHLDIIRRAGKLFDSVHIVAAINHAKLYSVDVGTRLEFIKRSCAGINNIVISRHDGLLVDYMKTHNIRYIVRGIRGAADFEAERQIDSINKSLHDIETVFLLSQPQLSHISSGAVRDLAYHSGDLTGYVHRDIIEEIYKAYGKRH